MKKFCALSAILVWASVALSAQSTPVPLLYQVSPASINPGHSSFTLSIHGTGMASSAEVLWNGHPLSTIFVSGSLVQAVVPASAVALSGTASVTVANTHHVHSNVLYFPVRSESSTVSLGFDSGFIEGGVPTVADFNNDGNADIFISGAVSESSYYLDTYLGDGRGGFTKITGRRYTTFGAGVGWPTIVGDFTNSGIEDIALPLSLDLPPALAMLRGNGEGMFTPERGVDGVGVAADMNGDGVLDFVTQVNDLFPNLMIYLSNHGSFEVTTNLSLTYEAAGAAVVGDFNNDGKLDVAIPGLTAMMVFLGNGDGTVQPEVDYPTTYGSTIAAVVDINGDGNLDIVTNGVCVLLGHGDGSFTNSTCVPFSRASGNVVIADVNGDRRLDVISTGVETGSQDDFLSILLGNGDGTFQTPINYDLGQYGNQGWGNSTFGVADFNNDGKLDFAIGGISSSIVLLQR